MNPERSRYTQHRAPPAAAAVLLAAMVAHGVSLAGDASDRSDPSRFYEPKGTQHHFSAMGYYSTGLGFADINGDGWKDMIVANGNDMSPQPLVVYYNDAPGERNVFHRMPDWYSDEIDYMMGLAVGDIDGNGWIDVAVSVPFDRDRRNQGGGVKVFFNLGGALEGRASYRIKGFTSLGCALGDVDADADLDLVVAVHSVNSENRAVALLKDSAVQGVRPGRPRIYLNEGGKLGLQPAWTAREPLRYATDAVVADMDQDGWMDVAFSAQQPAIYYHSSGSARVPISKRPGWLAAAEPALVAAEPPTVLEGHYDPPGRIAYGIDVGGGGTASPGNFEVPGGEHLMLAVSYLCIKNCPPSSGEDDGFFLYQPKDPSPFWEYRETTHASKVLLADLNGDGFLDLAGGQLGESLIRQPCDAIDPTCDREKLPEDCRCQKALGGKVLVFFGEGKKGLPSKPGFESHRGYTLSGQALALGNLKRRKEETCTSTFQTTKELAVLTLPQRRIEMVEDVFAEEQPGSRRWEKIDYSWIPDANWISFAEKIPAGRRVKITYRISPIQDIGMAAFNPQLGLQIFFGSDEAQSQQVAVPPAATTECEPMRAQ